VHVTGEHETSRWYRNTKRVEMSEYENIPCDEILPEYSLEGGVRGRYAARDASGTNLVRLDADVAAVFPDSDSVNRALRAIAGIIQEREAKSAA
jgi:hypothetical protein